MPSIEKKYNDWRTEYVRAWVTCEVEQKNAITCSEAIGYGMLISVLMRNQQDFDGLLRWFLHLKTPMGFVHGSRLMISITVLTKTLQKEAKNSATDGDIDIATSLFYAAKIAIPLCKAIWDHEINHYTFMPTLGDWVKVPEPPKVSAFGYSGGASVGEENAYARRFLTFYNEDPERSPQWAKVMDAIITNVQHQLSLNPTGLIADFLKLSTNGYYEPAAHKVLESDNDKDFNWNSCRVPWRLSVYYLLTHDPRICPTLMAQSSFFGSLSEVCAGYHLNGHKIHDRNYCDMSFTAPASLVMWTMRHPNQTRLQDQMENLESDRSYFGDSIQMLCLLQARNPTGF
ncbi:Six-hairpin glycosidase-like protein [Lobosporangium transversale]|uniref:Six-hairpin glycosidase-like protein n=1 Tax=Lobosporangium transversale TaxID=64571 RepID=A0A1Y2H127_9FUNG|nr:Six-hairpin glycosidase-like protein [Lobosporangium transversale]ORZ28259.1 Six-hairpin glycosidase-like protein [Lobosporangium transversale]|eukprot:XP_021885944.1 Six-hairpin glycosidase-like protein [Lobosporangium transversale]